MKIGLAMGSLGILGILALADCAGTSGSVSVSGTDPASLRAAPAGTSIFVFMDLEGIRPDQLQNAVPANLPECVQAEAAGGTTTFSYNQCKAANSGVLTGTTAVTGPTAGTGGTQTYTQTFNLTVTTTLPGNATQVWTYTGSQLVTFNGAVARVSLANPAAPIRAVFTDRATPANNRTYAFTPSLTENTGDATRLTMSGGYTLAGDNGDTITGTISAGNPLVWIPTACKYPSSGALTLNLVGNAGTDQTTASFASGCGNLNVGGATVALGGS
ncbi:MAG: hypothetical protein P4L36_06695 [Holophaga sp.]|nr:hypothetical protein [Holophaga sp.]